MQSITECYRKVSKDCFKFIKSQETSKEKFKNKEKMIKSFLIPISFWISNRTNKSKPYLIGLAGGQGTGKTTISSILRIILTKYFKEQKNYNYNSYCFIKMVLSLISIY